MIVGVFFINGCGRWLFLEVIHWSRGCRSELRGGLLDVLVLYNVEINRGHLDWLLFGGLLIEVLL